jgi:flavin-dependent dehydrogenase
MAYDVIVVGARAAGAATALLLARAGLRVLAVDRARFPSDTLSTHQIQVPGVARLRRFGLLERIAAGAPATRRLRLDAGSTVLTGNYPTVDGADALYSPRRTVLDAALVDAARAAGAQVRERFTVSELTHDAGRVTGVRGRSHGGAPVRESAALVVGADGKRSMVAAAVGAARYRVRPPATFACYTYWSDVCLPTGEIYLRPGLAVPAFPSNDGLAMVAMIGPLAGFDAFRRDQEGAYLAALDRCGDLGARIRAGTRAERFRAAPDVPNCFRVPHGPGWALVGDAGLVMDPVSAQGISNAFRDAELLADAVVAGLRDGTLDRRLAGYHRARDAAAGPMYDLTGTLATLRLGGTARLLLRLLDGRPAEADRLLAVLAGAAPPRSYLRPATAARLLASRVLS